MADDKSVPRGKPVTWSDDDLDEFSRITPEIVERSKIAWRRDAPPAWRDLPDAEPIIEDIR